MIPTSEVEPLLDAVERALREAIPLESPYYGHLRPEGFFSVYDVCRAMGLSWHPNKGPLHALLAELERQGRCQRVRVNSDPSWAGRSRLISFWSPTSGSSSPVPSPNLPPVAARPRTRQRKGFVYAMRLHGTGHVKVGWAVDPEKRKAALQTAAPGRLEIVRTIPGGRDLERKLHRKLSAKRVHGEWFVLTSAEVDAL